MQNPSTIKLPPNHFVWSFSRFSRFKSCQEQYRLKDLERVPVPPYTQKPFLQGSVAHKTFEDLFKSYRDDGQPFTMDRAYEIQRPIFERYAANIQWRNHELISATETSHDLVSKYFNLLTQVGVDNPENQIECEYWFGTNDAPFWMDNGVGLVGSIDWLIKRPDGSYLIYDAKSSQTMEYLDRDQLRFYALAVRERFGILPEQVGYLMIRKQQVIPYEITNQEVDDLLVRLYAASKQSEQGLLSATPSTKLCSGCQFSTVCRPFKEWSAQYLQDLEF